jgi:hypothetical protein
MQHLTVCSDNQIVVQVHGARPENILIMVHEAVEGLISDFFKGIRYRYKIPCPQCLEEVRHLFAIVSKLVWFDSLQRNCHCCCASVEKKTIMFFEQLSGVKFCVLFGDSCLFANQS